MLRIYLTGDPCLSLGSKLVRADRLPGRQGRRVFAYLSLERSRPVTRGELAECVWPEHLPAAFDVALSAIISKLRALLVEVGLSRRTLTSASGCYRLDLAPGSWIDVEEAIQSVHASEASLLKGDSRGAYGPAVVACSILRRPFLPGEEGSWIDARRQVLRAARLRALDCLAQVHTTNGEHGLALRAAEEAVEAEPFREEGYRRLMLLHDESGNGAEALRVYAKLRALLTDELGSSPSPETRRLFEIVSARSNLS